MYRELSHTRGGTLTKLLFVCATFYSFEDLRARPTGHLCPPRVIAPRSGLNGKSSTENVQFLLYILCVGGVIFHRDLGWGRGTFNAPPKTNNPWNIIAPVRAVPSPEIDQGWRFNTRGISPGTCNVILKFADVMELMCPRGREREYSFVLWGRAGVGAWWEPGSFFGVTEHLGRVIIGGWVHKLRPRRPWILNMFAALWRTVSNLMRVRYDASIIIITTSAIAFSVCEKYDSTLRHLRFIIK